MADNRSDRKKLLSPPTSPHDPPKTMKAATHRLKAYALKKLRHKMRYNENNNDEAVNSTVEPLYNKGIKHLYKKHGNALDTVSLAHIVYMHD